MNSRSIEGENPLYLPQARVYAGCAAIGPCPYITDKAIEETAKIKLGIYKTKDSAFSGEAALTRLKRKPQELANWLFRGNIFPIGCFMMTGMGIVPDGFMLEVGDWVRIEIDEIGVLESYIEKI